MMSTVYALLIAFVSTNVDAATVRNVAEFPSEKLCADARAVFLAEAKKPGSLAARYWVAACIKVR